MYHGTRDGRRLRVSGSTVGLIGRWAADQIRLIVRPETLLDARVRNEQVLEISPS